jgi:hypothetical protein
MSAETVTFLSIGALEAKRIVVCPQVLAFVPYNVIGGAGPTESITIDLG